VIIIFVICILARKRGPHPQDTKLPLINTLPNRRRNSTCMEMGWFPAAFRLKLANEIGRIIGCESVHAFNGRGHLSCKIIPWKPFPSCVYMMLLRNERVSQVEEWNRYLWNEDGYTCLHAHARTHTHRWGFERSCCSLVMTQVGRVPILVIWFYVCVKTSEFGQSSKPKFD